MKRTRRRKPSVSGNNRPHASFYTSRSSFPMPAKPCSGPVIEATAAWHESCESNDEATNWHHHERRNSSSSDQSRRMYQVHRWRGSITGIFRDQGQEHLGSEDSQGMVRRDDQEHLRDLSHSVCGTGKILVDTIRQETGLVRVIPPESFRRGLVWLFSAKQD